MKNLLRVNGTAEFLAMSKSNVWRLTKEGILKSHKLSDSITVWKVEELQAFINERIGA